MLNKAVINLGKIKENAFAVKKLLPPTTKFCAVVKADAYGHGAEKVASALYGAADCFAVAIAEEGVALRLSGIDKDILTFTLVGAPDFEQAARYGLTITASRVSDIKEAERAGRLCGMTVKAHIKYNTGMNRQGATGLENLKRILDYADKCAHVDVTGMYSHYAAPENDGERNKATDKFLLANNLIKSYNNKAICHISASGGVLKGVFFDMARVGIMLYGYKPFKSDFINLSPAMKVYAPVIENRTLIKGEGALYGLKPAEGKTKIALARYGYADGLPRKEAGRLFNNRCMDVSAYISAEKRGKSVCVLDDAERIAEKYGTISYEILTRATARAEKIYVD